MTILRDILTFIRAWRIAATKMASAEISKYRPEARHLIVYSQVKSELTRKFGEVEGCLVHAAVALAYRFSRKKIQSV